MPQMSPYNWLILFLYFNMIIFFIMTHINFMSAPQSKFMNINVSKMTFIWMW